MLKRQWNRSHEALCNFENPLTGKQCGNRIKKGDSYFKLRSRKLGRRFCMSCGEKMQH